MLNINYGKQYSLAIPILCVLTMALPACDQQEQRAPSPQQAESPAPSRSATPYTSDADAYADEDGMRTTSFVGLSAAMPAEWSQQRPQSPMHQAMFTVPAVDDDEDAQIVVFYFGPGQGGSVEANIERWANQFRSAEGGSVEPDVRTIESDQMSITLVELAGEYMALGATAYAPDQHFVSAIVDTPAPASRRIFIRFVGDAATVKHNRDAFITMIEGLRWIGE